MKRILSVLLLLLLLRCYSAQELVYEHYNGYLYGKIIIPYETLVFPKDQEQTSYVINLQIKNNQDKWINIIRDLNITVPRRLWLENTAIPIDFGAPLEPGTYKAVLKLRNKKMGIKRQLNRELIIGKQDTEIGPSWITAMRDSVVFIPPNLDEFGSQYSIVDFRQRFSLVLDSLRISRGDNQLIINQPVSPVSLDLSPYLKAGISEKLSFSVFEANIQYNLEPFLYTPWFSYSIRYSLEDQISQLRYEASQNEWQVLSKLPASKYAEAIDGFWKNHDPSPGTARNESRESFSQRVIRADEQFTIHKKLQGWKSDRGRIYIKYGEPDDISSETFPLGRYPNIIWSYYKENRRFIFADIGGYGQYTLRNKQDEY